ncbi:helix-turn-helix transcriptional regulator [Halosolutus amylolyticus]|uniref:Helix-turn-helix transcriptional regulator n=1 Tax=Halosolutus amylolyticus TaxID=2932267 RepID=A0ABD5PTD1_9EURY|nr:helix-turn-helix domain-containing protein [Halosolutus amylolyticus]
MMRPQAPFVSRLSGAVRRTVRRCRTATGSEADVSTDRAGTDRGGTAVDTAARVESTDRSLPVAQSAPESEPSRRYLDPGRGPTSRSEILDHGISPEAYVRAVLEKHDGRLKQRRFADEYGWSASTVSRLLSDLEARGAIERYQLGREKIVCLPSEVPAPLEKGP